MFFSKDHNKLYLSTVKFNIARVFTILAETVNDAGGRVKETTPGFIIDRTIYDKISDIKSLLSRVENAINAGDERSDLLKKVLDSNKETLDTLEKKEAEIIPTPATIQVYILRVVNI